METYFAFDGNYGEWKDSTCFILPTDDFTDEHWQEIDAANDWERPIIAMEIRERLDKAKA
jgi:hypothetical protein